MKLGTGVYPGLTEQPRIITLGILTFNIMTFGILTFNMMTLGILI
jgi:hypothetical protein